LWLDRRVAAVVQPGGVGSPAKACGSLVGERGIEVVVHGASYGKGRCDGRRVSRHGNQAATLGNRPVTGRGNVGLPDAVVCWACWSRLREAVRVLLYKTVKVDG
jgi:hypothetical protein